MTEMTPCKVCYATSRHSPACPNAPPHEHQWTEWWPAEKVNGLDWPERRICKNPECGWIEYAANINKNPVDGPTNPQDIFLDPEYVLSVFKTSDVSGMYEAIMKGGAYGLPANQPANFGELPQVVRLSLIETAQRVFQDAGRQHDALMDALTDALSERFCFHCGDSVYGEWVCGWCAGNLCSQCMKNRLTFGHPCPVD